MWYDSSRSNDNDFGCHDPLYRRVGPTIVVLTKYNLYRGKDSLVNVAHALRWEIVTELISQRNGKFLHLSFFILELHKIQKQNPTNNSLHIDQIKINFFSMGKTPVVDLIGK